MVKALTSAMALLLFTPAPSVAAIINYTFTGSLLNGKDDLGLFGAPSDLTGKSYSLIFALDDTKGAFNGNVPFAYNLYDGGLATPVSASLTVGGVNFNFDGLYNPSGYFGSSDPFAITDFASGGSFYAFNLNAYDSAGTSNYQLGFGRRPGEDDTFSRFYVTVGNNATFGQFGSPPTPSIWVTNSAVPEAPEWAMMILGFGAIGGVLRSRRVSLFSRPESIRLLYPSTMGTTSYIAASYSAGNELCFSVHSFAAMIRSISPAQVVRACRFSGS